MSSKNYTVRELLQDPSFQRFAKGIASLEEIERWNGWIGYSAHNRKKSGTAIAQIVGFEFKGPPIPDIEKQWALLYKKTAGKEKKVTRNQKGNHLNWMFRAAAVLLLISSVWAGVFLTSNGDSAITHLEQLFEETTIRTTENEQKTLKFSNGSSIVLNSNSTLSYRIGQIQHQTMEVSLYGEAWFVAEEVPGQKEPVFAVSTPDGVIRDIGTEFLVSVHESGSRVVLQEGLVEISPSADGRDSAHFESEPIRVEKGELLEFRNQEVLVRKPVNPTIYSAWATGFLQLNRTTLEEFMGYVEQRFNVKAEIADAELSGITLDGAVYFKSLEGLVRSVSEVTGIPVYRSAERDTVYIGNPNMRAMTSQGNRR